MQAARVDSPSEFEPQPRRSSFLRALAWFLVVPVSVFALLLLIGGLQLMSYQERHEGRIYTGVQIWGIDLSGMNREEARQALMAAFPYPQEEVITLSAPTGHNWFRSPAELGISFAVEETLDSAFAVGRQGGMINQLRDQFDAWYFGRALSPIIIFDEGKLDAAIAAIADEVDQPVVDATVHYDGATVEYTPAQVGYVLDRADTRSRLLAPVTNFSHAQIELLVHENQPRIRNTADAANRIQQFIGSPMTLYLQEPLDGVDLDRVTISTQELTAWLRIELVDNGDGTSRYEVFMDENGIRHWLTQYEAMLSRPPVNARFYFDDNTRQLVLVENHINGRTLDIEATAALFMQQVGTANRSLPFLIKEVVPVVHSGVTAEELGITELISERTTWFYDSTAERKHNIARAASNFYGIVIAPGEEFSFNRYLGDVSAEDGYETGLIIYGGRTIEGVGGGVCQVSTTLYQAAFWAGFPIVERWEHAYRVHYYDDGEGPGMDATVFSPIVDFRFINNTPHYLLIENYYNETFQSLTFKFYSTSMGRTVEKDGPFYENQTPARPDMWEFNAELAPGEIKQVDWAVDGADVTVVRRVYNYQGELMYGEEVFTSHYIPWQNIYQYGPEVDPPGAAGPVPASTVATNP